ncbi:SGNH/GDSL hydrolase family protein [Planctomonas sp. JC2975]|uniref:SGNH/GDSL hydrolase family protein n=1 Tax=Planctomonas sp. JC2975 TaxID=2729626 RepID=UPI001475A743|nr:SGNH/GDSL hydrolase family protein [Planctomonas sp. JC2975]NNC12436.1 SGNH/GDSL hydrolase family protein [Planctomonas sp. JC2975]
MAKTPLAALALITCAAAAVIGCGALAISTALNANVHRHPVTSGSTARASTVVAIGDSIMNGHGLDSVYQAWPYVLGEYNGWRLVNLSTDGAGFVTKGNSGGIFADQVTEAVRFDPSMVVISGSSNDLGVSESDVQQSMIDAMQTLRHDLPRTIIVAVSPVWNENEPPSQLDEIDDDMHAATASVDGYYLEIGTPLLNKPGYMQSDDVHPNSDGQLTIAAAVEQQLEKQHLV